jgi:hypothetical protein
MSEDRVPAGYDASAGDARDDEDATEPPPLGTILGNGIYSEPMPFGSPPAEDITIEGDVPWELADAVPFGDERDERDAREAAARHNRPDPDATEAHLI